MSLTLITAVTSLRVLIGVAGVGYSIFANKDESGNFKYGEISTSIFGQAIGGVFYDWLKTGASIGYDQLTAKLDALDADALNHDLQRAARKSVLLATFMACQGCLADIKSERRSIFKRIKNLAWKDEDINWLIAVAKQLQDEINNLDKAEFSNNIEYSELFNIFDKDNIANSETAQKEYAGKLREEILKDIKNNYYSSFGGLKTIEFSDNAFKLLSEAMENGWSKFEADRGEIVQLRLTANGRQVKDYDWFKLVCLIFNEEYKVNEKLEAAMEKQTTLEQTAILKEIQSNLSAFGRIENFHDLERQINDFREENFWYHQRTHEMLRELKEIVLNQLRVTNPPVPVHNLPPLTEKVYGRESEKARVLAALHSPGKKFSLVVAPSGFGKTRLLAKILQDYTDGRDIFTDEIDRLMLIDCHLTQNLTDITRELNTVLGTQLSFESRLRNYNEAWLKLVFEMIDGRTWLFLDNFEAWLADDYELINAEIRAFLNVLFNDNHGFRGVVLSQSQPESGILNSLDLLREVGAEISAGLDEDSAIQYLRDNADSGNGLDTAPEELLVRFLKEVHYIPQALNSLTGYLKSISGYTFAEFMNKDNGFWAQFDESEQNETDLEKGIRRTKALIKQQILKQSPFVKGLMIVLSFFTRPVPREALEIFFENKAQAANPISRLKSHNLAIITTGNRGTNYYELHAYFREQSLKWLNKFEDTPAEILELNAEILTDEGFDSYRYNFFNRCFALFELSKHILHHLIFVKGEENLKNDLAKAYMNTGNALDKLGRLNEAVDEYDKAIAIFEDSFNEQNRDELADDLAMANMSKGFAFWSLGRFNKAIDEYDKAIAIIEDLVNKQNRKELANKLAQAFGGKGIAFNRLGRLNEAVDEINKAIAIYEDLVFEQKRDGLANALAAAYMNKGIVLANLGRLNEAVDEFEKAIAIFEDSVNEQNRDELADDLAKSYMNKGFALDILGRLNEAVDEYDKSEKVRQAYLQRKEFHVLPDFVMNIRNRIEVLIKLENWQDIAIDINKAMYETDNYLAGYDISEHFRQLIENERDSIIQNLRAVSTEDRGKIYRHCGDNGDEIRELIENSVE